MAKVGVIGAGSWGIALAKLLRTNGNEVTVWSIVEEEVAMLRREHEHIDKLPGVKLPEDVLFTTDLKEAIVGKEFLILAVPSVFTRSTAKSMAGYVTEGQIIVCVAKGIEEDTLMTISDVTEQEIPCADVAVMCGPSHAEEVGIGCAVSYLVWVYLPLPITVSWQQPVLRSWYVWEYLHWQLISLYFTLVLLQISHRR